MKVRYVAYLALLSLLLQNPAAAQSPISYKVNFTSYQQPIEVQFRAWLPGRVERLRGLVFSFPGTRGDNQGIANSPLWQLMVEQMGFGIVGFRDAFDGMIEYWGADPAEGHDNLQLVLDRIATDFQHPEIRNVPILAAGVSQGGWVSGELASLVPERVLGVFADKGHCFCEYDQLQSFQAPVYIVGGVFDLTVPADYLNDTFHYARQQNANTALQLEWRTGHVETSENLQLTYLNQALRARYPAGQLPSLTAGEPLPLLEPPGWLMQTPSFDEFGDPVFTSELISGPEDQYPLDSATASWLPTETMARVYVAHHNNTRSGALIQVVAPRLSQRRVPLSLTAFGIDWTQIDVYHEEELVASLLPGSGSLEFIYQPAYNGLHTFFARATYLDGGETKYAENFYTTTVFGIVPEPASVFLLGLFAIGLAGSRLQRSCG